MDSQKQVIIRVRGLTTQFGRSIIHDGLDLDVMRGEVIGIVGGSGTGKSVLMRSIIGLNTPKSGTIEMFGQNTSGLKPSEREAIDIRTGVLFQDGALFSSMTVAENIMAPMREHTDLPLKLMLEIVALKVSLVGLPQDACGKFPSELSGGMRKRAGLARALALDPEILFLDEPTAGLDPISAAAFDSLIGSLQQTLDLTVMMVTHDLDSLLAICDRIAVLVDRRIIIGTVDELMQEDHPWIRDYFHGPRARAAMEG
ncbi:MAG: ABC transporter ATP-binding protein [Rhodospirillaceae bacterium]|jgi:phospholipid/cholesterol/gamma-HCH transport system ATP-binding protein|nr:ABC transporter ATP-binding protein [Rhodospirillaceae bacterium]